MPIRYLSGLSVDSTVLVVDAANDRVGIGTASPADRLQVNGGVTFGSDTVANNRSRIYESFGLNLESGAASRPIIFRTTLIERMRVTDAGNVGIGTTNPLEKLSVDGGIGILSGGAQEYHIVYLSGGLSFTETGIADGRLFLKDGGNVGIGTTSPTKKLDVTGDGLFSSSGSGDTLTIAHSSGSGIGIKITKGGNGEGLYVDKTSGNGNAVTIIGTLNATTLVKSGGTSSQYLMADGSVSTLTNPVTGTGTTNYVPKFTSASAIGNSALQEVSGNLGLGVTPVGFRDIFSAFQIGYTGAVYALTVANATEQVNLASNYYQNSAGNELRIQAGFATRYQQASGEHRWSTAGSSSAGSAITFTQAMTLTASGNVGIGTTGPNFKLDVNGTFHSGGDATFNGTNTYINSSYIYVGNNTGDLVSISGNTMYFPGDGNVGIENTVPGARLTVGPQSSATAGSGVAQDNSIVARFGASNAGLRVTGATIANTATATVGNDATLSFIVAGNFSATGLISSILQNTSTAATDMVFSVYNSSMQERMRIAANGNVGIGTTAPDAKLVVTGDSTGTAKIGGISIAGSYTGISLNGTLTLSHYNFLSAPNDASLFINRPTGNAIRFREGNSEQVTIATGGNVGIGTTAPNAKLHVFAGASNNTLPTNAQAIFEFNANGGIAVSTPPANAAGLYFPHETSAYYAGIDRFETNLRFFSGNSEKMRITSAGNVGIGTTSPVGKLDVQANDTGVHLARVWNTNAAGTGASVLRIANSGNNNNGTRIEFTDQQYYVATISADRTQGIIFRTSATGTDPITIDERMRIAANGHVGIGTTSPDFKLDISGVTRFQDIVRFKTNAWNLSDDGHSRFYFGHNARTYFGSQDGYEWRSAGDTALAVITNAGNVGIGTTAPAQKLDVISGNLRLRTNATGLGPSIILNNGTEVAGNYSQIAFGGTQFDSTYLKGAIAYVTRAETNGRGDFYFLQNTANSPTNASLSDAVMVISNTGNVGIGTTSPGAKLQVVGAAVQGEGLLNISNTFASGGVYFPAAKIRNTRGDHSFGIVSEFSMGAVSGVDRPSILFYADAAAHSWQVGQVTSGWGSNDSFGIGYRANNLPNTFNTWPTSYFTILTSGNVGIGTTAPTSKFQVNNNAGTGSAFYVDAGNPSGTTTLFEHTGANTPVAFAITKSGYSGSSVDFGILYIDMAHNVVGGGSNMHFTLRNSSGNRDEYGGLGASIVTNTAGATAGRLNFYTTNAGAIRNIRMVVNPDGNVGIGTTAPATLLSLGAYSGSRLPYINGTANTFNSQGITVTSSNTANAAIGGGIDLTNNVHSVGSFSPLISFSALSQSGLYNNNYAAIYGILAGAGGDANWNQGHIVFATADSYGASEKVRITSAGNVGIGTTAPSAGFGGAIANVKLALRNGTVGAAGGTSVLLIGGDNNHYSSITAEHTGGGDTYLSFGTSTGAVNPSEKMRITAGGNVGIGTTAPTNQLNIVFPSNIGKDTVQGIIRICGQANTENAGTVPSAGTALEFYNKWNGGGSTAEYSVARISGRAAQDYAGGLQFDVAPPQGPGQSNFLTAMTILRDGNVGIGTTAPAAKLVVESGGFAVQGVSSWPTSGFGLEFWNNSTTSYIGSYNRTTSVYRDMFLFAKDTIFENGGNQIMRITSAGNVGIGVTSTSAKLESYQSAAWTGSNYTIKANGYSTFNGLRINGQDTERDIFQESSLLGIGIATSSAQPIKFLISTSSEIMRVAANGNVGIGTTAPTKKLHVVGAIRTESGEILANTNQGGIGWVTIEPTSAIEGQIALNVVNSSGASFASIRGNGNAYFSGNVGIGNSSPGGNLDVQGASTTNVSYFRTNGAANRYILSVQNIENTAAVDFRAHGSTYSETLFGNSCTNAAMIVGQPSSGAVFAIGNVQNGPLVLATNNAERLRITAAGNVGIGTTAPGARLQIGNGSGDTELLRLTIGYDGSRSVRGGINWHDGSQTTGRIYTEYDGTMTSMVFGSLYNSGYNSNNLMIIRGNGNVGIGTTAPSEKLHVDGSTLITYNNSFQSTNSIGNKAILARVSPTSGIINYAEYATAANLNGFVIGSDDARVKGNITGDSLEFITNTSTRMTILSGGNVGINNTNPARTLDVTGSARVNSTSNLAMFIKTSSGFGAGISYEDSTTGGNDVVHAGAIGDAFYITTGYSERMRITSAGNVGIGTTSPQYMLDVNGDAQINAIGNSPSNTYVPDGGFGVDSLITSGSENVALGKPDVWLRIHVDGVAFVFPGYQEP